MAKNDKSTEEILEEDPQKILEEIDELENDPSSQIDDEDSDEEENPDSNEEDSEDDEESSDEEEEEEEEQKPAKKENDVNKRYVESTREAQVLYAKNKKLNEAIDQASEIKEPTEEELNKEYSDWEEMTDTERRLAKENYINSKRFELIHNAAQEGKDIAAWNEKVDEYIGDPKTIIDNPELDGKEEEFKIFASKPTRRGLDFEDLVLAFNGANAMNRPPKKKGKLIESGNSGGSDKVPRKTKLTLSESSKLRTTNYDQWVKLVQQGKIDIDEV